MTTRMQNRLIALFALLSVAPVVYFRALAVQLLWLWFVAPLGVAPIGKLHVVGLLVLFALFKNPGYKKPEEPDRWKVVKEIAHSSFMTSFAIGIGYLITLLR